MLKQNFFNVDPALNKAADQVMERCRQQFDFIDEVREYNQLKLLSAFTKCGVSESHFAGSSGYGYDDRGRDILDRVFAQAVGAEDALVRHNFVSGTHALSVALFGVLRPNDILLSLTGKPYDTLEETIGLRGQTGNGSLIDFGVKYEEISLLADGSVDFDGISQKAAGVKVAYIQRSRGYSLRPSISIDTTQKIVQAVREVNPTAIIMVDNCYCEFVESKEPCEIGVDLIVGSLIKNPGGGLARTGGYIAGRKDLVALCANRLTCVGMGKEVGCTLNMNRELFMGLFMSPQIVGEAVKTAVFAAALFEILGYPVYPSYREPRTDLIQAVCLGTPERLISFCKGIQKGAPVDSFVTPEPWDMPGYDSQVIMAAGAFTLGASIELSADAPLKEPYAAWMQGSLTFASGKMGVILAAQSMLESGNLNC